MSKLTTSSNDNDGDGDDYVGNANDNDNDNSNNKAANEFSFYLKHTASVYVCECMYR